MSISIIRITVQPASDWRVRCGRPSRVNIIVINREEVSRVRLSRVIYTSCGIPDQRRFSWNWEIYKTVLTNNGLSTTTTGKPLQTGFAKASSKITPRNNVRSPPLADKAPGNCMLPDKNRKKGTPYERFSQTGHKGIFNYLLILKLQTSICG